MTPRLTSEAVDGFWADGVIGPLVCEAPQLENLLVQLLEATPARSDTCFRNIHDPQDYLPAVHDLAQHPSILHPVAQLLGCTELSFFQARFRVKAPGRPDDQPWHQDVGKNHGGLFADGTPIPSITLWLSLDGADADSGGVMLIPGSHRSILGDWKNGFYGLKDQQGSIDTSSAVSLVTPPGHFHLFHSWVVHCSRTNQTKRARSALILRYMDRRHAQDVHFLHQPCAIA